MNPGLRGNLSVLQRERDPTSLHMCACVRVCVRTCVSMLKHVTTQLFTKEAVPVVKVRHRSGEMTVFAHRRRCFGAFSKL